MFLTSMTLTLGQGQMLNMPGIHFFQDASTIAISSRSDFGKVVKSESHWTTTDYRQTQPSHIAEPKVSAKN